MYFLKEHVQVLNAGNLLKRVWTGVPASLYDCATG